MVFSATRTIDESHGLSLGQTRLSSSGDCKFAGPHGLNMIGMQSPLSSSKIPHFARITFSCWSQKSALIDVKAAKISLTMMLRCTLVWPRWTRSLFMTYIHNGFCLALQMLGSGLVAILVSDQCGSLFLLTKLGLAHVSCMVTRWCTQV